MRNVLHHGTYDELPAGIEGAAFLVTGPPAFAGLYVYSNSVWATIPDASVDPFVAAMGFKAWRYFPESADSDTVLTDGTIYAGAMYLPKGTTVGGLVLSQSIAGDGTPPTHFYTALAHRTLGIINKSDDLAASPILTGTGYAELALASGSSRFTVPEAGLYYGLVLQVGTWGTTEPKWRKATKASPTVMPTRTLFGTGGTGQTAFGDIGGSVTVTAADPDLWMGIT